MIARRRTAPLALAMLALLTLTASCSEEVCQEPDPRGDGAADAECETTRDCGPELICLGTDFEASALCSLASELPGGGDPGCLEHPDDWSEHEANGVQPTGPDEQGCEQLVFISGCNCIDTPLMEDCLPVMPFYRQETWRRCSGCCWRLASFWQDESACEDPGD